MGLTNPKWLIGIFMLFAVLTVISGILEGTYLGTEETSLMRDAMSPPLTNIFAMPGWLLRTVPRVIFFDYAFFHGEWRIFKYIFFWPIGIGVMASFCAILIQASIVAIRGVAGGILGFLGR